MVMEYVRSTEIRVEREAIMKLIKPKTQRLIKHP